MPLTPSAHPPPQSSLTGIGTLLGGIGAVCGAALTWIINAGKSRAERIAIAAQASTDRTNTLIEGLQTSLNTLWDENRKLREEISGVRTENRQLSDRYSRQQEIHGKQLTDMQEFYAQELAALRSHVDHTADMNQRTSALPTMLNHDLIMKVVDKVIPMQATPDGMLPDPPAAPDGLSSDPSRSIPPDAE